MLDTTQMYFFFCHKTPSMPLKRALMILAASCEFDKRHNSEIIERITDNEEVPSVSICIVEIFFVMDFKGQHNTSILFITR